MTQPLVSIITPSYNCGRFLNQTISSVLDQEYAGTLQYLVVDDGSTDGTWDGLGMWSMFNDESRFGALRDYEVIIGGNRNLSLRSQANIGEQATVNRGLKMVEGKYFMVVNADDPLLPGCVSALVDFMEAHPDMLCVYPHVKTLNEDGSFRSIVKRPMYDFEYMVRHHTCAPSVGAMFRSTVLQTVGLRDESLRWLGDFDYWLRLGLQGKMALYPQTLACWRHRGGQASKDRSDERAAEHVKTIKLLYDRLKPHDALWDVYSEAECWANIVAAGVCKSRRKMLAYTGKAIAHYPRLFTSLEFWDAARKRIAYLVRR